jgi:secreted Zn-dependent insulinase-like peptidase
LSGKTTLAVKQDLFRIIARANLNQIISISTTTNQTKNINCKRKSDYQINRQQAFRKSKKIIEMIDKIPYRKWLDKIKNFANELMRQLEIVRPNRKIPIARR